MSVRNTLVRLATLGCAVMLVTGAGWAAPAKPKKKTTPKAPAAQQQQQPPAEDTKDQDVQVEQQQANSNKALLAYLWTGVGPTEFEITNQTTSTTKKAAGAIEENSEKHTFLTLAPTPDPEKKFWNWIDVSWNRLTLRYTAGGKTFELDTDNQDTSKAGPFAPVVKAFQAIKGQKVRVRVSPAGVINKVEGFEPLVTAFKGAFPQDMKPPVLAQVVAVVFPTTPAELATQLGRAIVRLPVKNVDVGAQVPQTIPIGGGIALSGTTTFQGFEGEGPNRTLVIKQDLSAPATPPVTTQAEGQALTVSREQYTMNSTVVLAAEQQAPLKADITTIEKTVYRKQGAAPNAEPYAYQQTTTHVTTAMLRSAPAGQGNATATPAPGAPAEPGAPQTPPPTTGTAPATPAPGSAVGNTPGSQQTPPAGSTQPPTNNVPPPPATTPGAPPTNPVPPGR